MSETTRRAQRRAPAGIARHGKLRRPRAWTTVLKIVAASLTVVLVSGAALAGLELWRLQSSIKTVTLVGETEGPPPALGSFEGGFNLLVVGSDKCEDPGGCAGRGSAELNDVTILLHVSQDQTHAVAVSFPRDLVVPIPPCPAPSGGNYPSMSGQPINVTLSYGGLPCTVLTLESLTGLDIQFAGLVTFYGVASLATAVGGVTVCVDGPINDRYAGLFLPSAGEYELQGHDALAFLRSRHGVGDGSDLGRISSQQVYMSSLVRTLKNDGVLNDLGKLYNIANVAANHMTLSEGLSNVNTMVAMAQVLKNLPLERVMFVQYPGVTGQDGLYLGKVAPVKSVADQLFAKIRADEPFTVAAGNTGIGSTLNPNAPEPTVDPSPSASADAPVLEPGQVIAGLKGQSAADHTCSKAN
ncbi:MAG: LCP family protein [Cryobacterium sp.]|nr:LCP family protein [Cryobacterium sp.]